MSALYKRANSPYWWAWYKDESGKEVWRSTKEKRKKDAQRVLNRWLASGEQFEDFQGELQKILLQAGREQQEGKLTQARAEEHLQAIWALGNPWEELSAEVRTVKVWARDWLKERQGHISARTMESYQSSTRDALKALGKAASLPLGQLNTKQLQEAQRKLRKGSKARTVNRKLAALKICFSRAVKLGHIERSPFDALEPLPESDSVTVEMFALEEVRALIAQAREEGRHEWEGVILLGAHTGLRQSNIIELKWEAVELENRLLVLAPVKQRTAKGKAKMVRIPLSLELQSYFEQLPTPIKRSQPVFPALAKASRSAAIEQFQRLMTRAEVPKEIALPGGEKAKRTFHSLRHSFVSFLAAEGVAEEIRQGLSAHSDRETHQLYTHLSEEALRGAIDLLPKIG